MSTAPLSQPYPLALLRPAAPLLVPPPSPNLVRGWT